MGRAFFSSIRSTPLVKTESVVPINIVYEKWSLANNFDPDSDQFWDDAQLEKFIDADQPAIAEPLEDPESSSSSSSEGSDMDHASPVAEEPPTTVYHSPPLWERVQSEPWTYVSTEWSSDSARLTSSITTDRAVLRTHESDGNLPELVLSSSPTTPRYVYPVPSPAPTVTPRIYHWTSRRSPSSPSRGSSDGAGPLTNPTARRSLARITPFVVRVQGYSN
jgi:hypothetical protein